MNGIVNGDETPGDMTYSHRRGSPVKVTSGSSLLPEGVIHREGSRSVSLALMNPSQQGRDRFHKMVQDFLHFARVDDYGARPIDAPFLGGCLSTTPFQIV